MLSEVISMIEREHRILELARELLVTNEYLFEIAYEMAESHLEEYGHE